MLLSDSLCNRENLMSSQTLCVVSGERRVLIFLLENCKFKHIIVQVGMAFSMIGQGVLYWFTETYAEVRHSTQGNLGQIDNCFTNEHQHMY